MPEQVVYRGEGAIHELKGMLKRKTDGGIFIVGGAFQGFFSKSPI